MDISINTLFCLLYFFFFYQKKKFLSNKKLSVLSRNLTAWNMKGAQLSVTHVGLTAAEGCIVTAAVAVLAALCVAVALVLRVVLFTAPSLTRQRSL